MYYNVLIADYRCKVGSLTPLHGMSSGYILDMSSSCKQNMQFQTVDKVWSSRSRAGQEANSSLPQKNMLPNVTEGFSFGYISWNNLGNENLHKI
jgi:hypothetical protein